MDFRQSTIQHSEQKYAKILKGEAPPPYDGSVEVGSSDTYLSKRNAYVNRLSRENSEFDSAVRKINDTKNARLRNENDALEREAMARYKLFKMLKTVAFLLPIFLLAFMGIDIFSNSDKYQLVSNTPYVMLWIFGAIASVIVAVIAIICLYKKEIYYSRTNVKNEVKFSVLAIAVASVAVLVTALFLITKPSTSKDEDFVFMKGENGIVLMEYTGDAEIVIFPDTYEGKTYMVHYGLFYNNENAHKITKLVVPATSSFIGYYYSAIHSFSLLTSLRDATIPVNMVDYIPKNTLEAVTINSGYGSRINGSAFYNCTSLTSVTIGEGVTSIDSYAFSGCTSLTSITIPDSVTSIDWQAFSGCTSLTSVTIPDSVTFISDEAFYGCTSLTSVTIPDSVTFIGDEAFSGCASLTSVTIGDSVTEIGDEAFTGCPIENATIPTTAISSIPKEKLKTVVINGGASIDNVAFLYCTSLKSVTIPDSVTEIGFQAFYGCTSLTSVTIGDSVTSIGEGAFSYCTSLTSIEVDENNTVYKSIDGNLYSKDGKTLVKYAIGKTDASFVIPNSVTTIDGYAVFGCTSLTSVTIPNSVTSIGGGAFYGCTSLTSVTIPDSVTSIANEAFENCTSLTSITIGDSVTEIGDEAFTGCPIENATIPTTAISSIPKENLKTVVINGGDSIRSSAFYNYTSLTSVTIGDSVTEIGDEAFYNCTSLTSVTIGDSVTEIGYYAFNGCPIENATIPTTAISSIPKGKLKTVVINGGGSIGYEAFLNCTSLTSVIIGDGVTSIGKNAFYDCSKLTSVTIGDSVTSIGEDAFYRCTSLTSIIIGDSVTSIGNYAFDSCTSLTSVTIPNSITSIGYEAFYDCSSLTEINCEAESRPDGWNSNWKRGCDATVVWGYKGE